MWFRALWGGKYELWNINKFDRIFIRMSPRDFRPSKPMAVSAEIQFSADEKIIVDLRHFKTTEEAQAYFDKLAEKLGAEEI